MQRLGRAKQNHPQFIRDWIQNNLPMMYTGKSEWHYKKSSALHSLYFLFLFQQSKLHYNIINIHAFATQSDPTFLVQADFDASLAPVNALKLTQSSQIQYAKYALWHKSHCDVVLWSKLFPQTGQGIWAASGPWSPFFVLFVCVYSVCACVVHLWTVSVCQT